jgi:hypothetical protein
LLHERQLIAAGRAEVPAPDNEKIQKIPSCQRTRAGEDGDFDVFIDPLNPPVSGPFAIFESFRGHRFVPVTTISTIRPPQREQTSRSRQSRTAVSAPYLVAIAAGSGSNMMLTCCS